MSARPDIEGYEIIRELHRGGQGVVYQAIQKSTKRKVAVKLLLEGPYASKSARKRFEREIELVAQLKHPNIIAVFHSGQTRDGHAFCVMDYVRGLPLDQYVREKKLPLEEALKLCAAVCEAVNYAHQKGVIHRDLKPSNILVDSEGSPKVLDFGLAKQLLSPEATLVSVTGQVVGTLPYMSPEQAKGNPDEIDIRTDVYAMGVMLYEVLTGQYPYPVVGQMADVLKHIAETPPTLPSRQWKSDSGVTKRSTKRLRAGECPIDDEVQTIVMRSLAKERERRYQSAGELARDIGHYLANEPIEAKRDSGWYVLKKNLRRHKLPIGVAAASVMLLTAGMITLVSLWRQAEAERERAEKEAQQAVKEREKAVATNEFVTRALVSSDPFQGGEKGFLVTDAMIQAVELLDAGELKDQPETEAALRLTIAEILNGNGRFEEALRLAERALEIHEQLHPGDHRDDAASLGIVALCLDDLGRTAEALPKYQGSLEMYQHLYEGDHPDVAQGLNDVACCLHALGRFEEALPKFEAALEMKQRLFGGDHLHVANGLNGLAYCLYSLGRSTEALSKYEAALGMYQRLFEGDHPYKALCLKNTALCLESLGRAADALPEFEAALEMYQRLFEGDHMHVATTLDEMALCLRSLGRAAEALPKHEAALEMNARLFRGDHPHVALSLDCVAGCLRDIGRPAEALPKYEAALEMFRRMPPTDHPRTMRPQIGLGKTLVLLGRFGKADSLLLDAAKQCERSEAARQRHWHTVLSALIELHDAWHAAEPDNGYDQKAAEWRAKLAEWQATTQPASGSSKPDQTPPPELEPDAKASPADSSVTTEASDRRE